MHPILDRKFEQYVLDLTQQFPYTNIHAPEFGQLWLVVQDLYLRVKDLEERRPL